MAKKTTRKVTGRRASKKATAALVAPEAYGVTVLQVEGALDVLTLQLTWQGGVASLASLTDNGDAVNFSREEGLGRNALALTWRSPRAFRHVIQWDLWFQGTRTQLRGVARVNGQGGFARPVSAKEATSRWAAAGEAMS